MQVGASAYRSLAAKVTEMEQMAKQAPGTYEAFLVDAREDLAGAKKTESTVVLAPRAGNAVPHVKQGAVVHVGQLLVEIE